MNWNNKDSSRRRGRRGSARHVGTLGIAALFSLVPLAMMSCIADPILVQGTGGGAPTCTTPSDCPPTDNPCISAVCSGGLCGTTNTPFGITCDAMGTQACDGMTNCLPVNGQPCMNGAECLTGICADGVCCNQECTETCKSCALAGAVGSCADLPQGQTDDNAAQTCADAPFACDGLGACKSSIGQPCQGTADCASGFCTDGVCCDSECVGTCMACSAMGKGQGMDGVCEFVSASVDPGDECANGTCNGTGECKLDLGVACTVNTECSSGFCADNVCCDAQCSGTCEACTATSKGQGQDGQCGFVVVNVDVDNECPNGVCNGSGACKTSIGEACANNTECLSGFCADGFCCDTACSGTCEACSQTAKGQGTNGTCGPIALGLDPANECTNGACNGAGVCNIDQGIPCMNTSMCGPGFFCVDGYCCDTACTESCKSCGISGSTGICTNIPPNQIDTNAAQQCSLPTVACDGAGNCKKKNGETCGMPGECLSNFCVDGVCCESACTQDCKACNLAGSVGQCSNVATGLDDMGTCSGPTESCDSGTCKGENGQLCSTAGACLSNNCVDGFCCDTACTQDCKSCNVVGSIGQCSNVAKGVDDGTCSGAVKSCDAGLCKKENGQSCSNTMDCLSNNCVDGVCCNMPCSGTCQTCSTGACTNVAFGVDDPITCTGTDRSCDGNMSCKSEIGQSCTADSQCLQGSCNGGICTGASCNQLPAQCGPQSNQSCCQTGAIMGGMFKRSNDDAYLATVANFRLDRFEVTVGRFRKFVDAYPMSMPPMAGVGAHPTIPGSGWNSAWNSNLPGNKTILLSVLQSAPYFTWTSSPGGNENRPINVVDWYLAFAFCAWDGGRLPTETEWNYAAAGGEQQRTYPWGAAALDLTRANYDCQGDGLPTCNPADIRLVGQTSPQGDGRWGHADLAGNIMEWTLDAFAPYMTTCDNCANLMTGNSNPVTRGGHWHSLYPPAIAELQTKNRTSAVPTLHSEYYGIRCARMAP